MNASKKILINTVYVRCLHFNKCIKINLTNSIFLEQFASLSFPFHAISTQVYFASNMKLGYPEDGWITLDRQRDNDEEIFEISIPFRNLQNVLKSLKRNIFFDLKCLKRYECDITNSSSVVKFIEQIALSDDKLFKRVNLRQLKRIFNQKIIVSESKLKTHRSKINNICECFTYICNIFKNSKWFGGLILKEESTILTTPQEENYESIENFWKELEILTELSG